MVITKAKPSFAIEWFLKNDENHDLLCVFVSQSQRDYKQIKDLVNVRNPRQLDLAMGEKVAFLILCSDMDQIFGIGEGGRCTVFPGVFNGDDHCVSPYIPFRNVQDMRIGKIALNNVRKVIAKEMQNFVPKFIERYEGILYRDLPALYVFTKFTEEGIVFPLGKDWDIDYLASKLDEMKSIVHVNSEEVFLSVLDEERIKLFTNRMDGLSKKLSKIHKQIKTKLSALAWDYDGSPNDKNVLCKIVENCDYDPINLKNTLSRMTFGSHPNIESDSNMVSILSLASRYKDLEIQALALIEEERLLSENRSKKQSLLDILEVRDRKRKLVYKNLKEYVDCGGASFTTRIRGFKEDADVIAHNFDMYSSLGKNIASAISKLAVMA